MRLILIYNLKNMTKNDYKKIAQCLKNFKEYSIGKRITNEGILAFFIDEFSYMLEKNKNFNEKEFRQFIYNKS